MLSKILSILPLFFIQLAATISLVSFRDRFPLYMRWLSLVWIFTFAVEITGHITGLMNIRNVWLYNFFDIVFYILLIYIVSSRLKSRVVQLISRYFIIAFFLFSLYNIFFIQKLYNYNSYGFIAGGTFLILLSALYLREQYISEDTEKLAKDPFFWFCTGFLIYFGSTVPFFGMYNVLNDLYPHFTKFYHRYIYTLFSVLLNIFIAIGFLCRKSYQNTYRS